MVLRLDNILRRSIVQSSALTSLPKVLHELRDISHPSNERIKRVLNDSSVIVKNRAAIKALGDELRREHAHKTRQRVIQPAIQNRPRTVTHSISFTEKLKMNRVIPDDSYPSDEVTQRLDEMVEKAFFLLDMDTKAQLVYVLNWLVRDYIPLMNNLHQRQEKGELSFKDLKQDIETVLSKLNPKPDFAIDRFGYLDEGVKLHQLNAINRAIMEEVALPNGIFFDLQKKNPNIIAEPFIGASLGKEKLQISPSGRQVPLITIATLQGKHRGQVVEGNYIIQTLEYINLRRYVRDTVRLRFATYMGERDKVANSDFRLDTQNEPTTALVSSDQIASTQGIIGRRFNNECLSDLKTFADVNIRNGSSIHGRFRKARSIDEAKPLFRIYQGVRATVVDILTSENPVAPFLDAVVPVLYPSFSNISLPDTDQTFEQGLDHLVGLSMGFRIIMAPREKLLNDLRSLRRISKRYVDSILGRYFESNDSRATYMPQIIKKLREEKEIRDQNKIPRSITQSRSGYKLLELLGQHIDSRLSAKDGRIDRAQWDSYFQSVFIGKNKDAVQRQIEHLNHMLRIAARKVYNKHFDAGVDENTPDTPVDWKYFTPQYRIRVS